MRVPRGRLVGASERADPRQQQQQQGREQRDQRAACRREERLSPAGRKEGELLHHEEPRARVEGVAEPAVVAARPHSRDHGDAPEAVCARGRLRLGHERATEAGVLRVGVALVGGGDELPVHVQLPHQRCSAQLLERRLVLRRVAPGRRQPQPHEAEEGGAVGGLDGDEVLRAARRRVDPPHERLPWQHLLRGGAWLAASDAAASEPLVPHLCEQVLAQVRDVEPARHVLHWDVSNHAVEPDPRVHARLDLHEELKHLVARIRHVAARLEPALDDGPRHHLGRVDLPLVGLQLRVTQHALEHGAVHRCGRAGQVWHQVDVDLVAGVLEPLQGRHRVCRRAAAVDPLEHVVVGVLHSELHARAPVPAEAQQLRRVDGVRPRLEREADDLAGGGLVECLLLQQPPPRPLLALPKGVSGVEEVAHKLLLVDVRVGGPSAAQHEELDLVDGVAVLGESGGAVGQLHHGVEAVLIGALDGGLVVQVRLWLPRLGRAVVAVPRAREALLHLLSRFGLSEGWVGRGEDGDDEDARLRLGRLLHQQRVQVRIRLQLAARDEAVVRVQQLRLAKRVCAPHPLAVQHELVLEGLAVGRWVGRQVAHDPAQLAQLLLIHQLVPLPVDVLDVGVDLVVARALVLVGVVVVAARRQVGAALGRHGHARGVGCGEGMARE
mmetsp:Transcript_2069/g.5921  ORF Transcript_2069/g.5921 Transcript_2069/m.5921 type:complete len:666 (-) Transcript_2069:81-2078(-)